MENQIIDGIIINFPSLQSELSVLPKEYHREVKIKVFATMGCASFIQTQEQIDHVRKAVSETVADAMTVGPQVVIFREFVTELSDEEIKAIVFHELGHIKQDHLVKYSNLCNELGFLDNVQAEIEADSYAASVVGKEVMKSALYKVITGMPNVIQTWTNNSVDILQVQAEYQQILTSEMMTKRFKALN